MILREKVLGHEGRQQWQFCPILKPTCERQTSRGACPRGVKPRETDEHAGSMELRTSYANQHHGENLYASVIADNVNSVHQAAVSG
jgi:hypothetical protein